jgi:hypothetical protein
LLLRLYKREGDRTRYWGAWDIDRTVVIHQGVVGTRGELRHITLGPGQDAEAVIEAESAAARSEGFGPRASDPQRQVIVSCDTAGYEPDEVAGSASMLEYLCNERLGWTGNGYCDGPAYGKGYLSVFCPVVDRDLAVEAVVAQLRAHGCDNWEEWLTVSVPEGAGFRVVYRNPAAQRAESAEPSAAPDRGNTRAF